jgi:protein phosphatase-4 regulatory subunit 3
MSAPAALLHPQSQQSIQHNSHPNQQPQADPLPQPAPNTELSAAADSNLQSQQESQSLSNQDAIIIPTAVLDPAAQLTSSLELQQKQPESHGLDQQQSQDVKSEGVEPTLNAVNGTIELVQHAPGTISIEEAAVNVAEETGDWVQEGDQMKRVKVRPLLTLEFLLSFLC